MTTNARRLQRSTRITVAVALVAVSAVAVIAAVLAGSVLFLMLAGALAVVLGAAALQITTTELQESRMLHNHDRAEQARQFREIAARRTAENKLVVDSLSDRLASSRTENDELRVENDGVRTALDDVMEQCADLTRRNKVQSGRLEKSEKRNRALTAELADAKVENGRLTSELAMWQENVATGAEIDADTHSA